MPELVATVEDLDDYGLDRWCFVFEGSHDEPFASLHRDDPASWRRLVDHVDPP